MNPVTQLDGERIAAAVTERAKAVETLAKTERNARSFIDFLIITGGSALGSFLTTPSHFNHTLVSGAASVGLTLAVLGYRQAVIARRRVDALLVLTQSKHAQ